MSKSKPATTLQKVTQPFTVQCHIWYSAPYSGSEEIRLIEGMLLNVYDHADLEESVRYEATVVDSHEWAPFLISTDSRHDKNFNYSFNFYLTREQLDQCCEEQQARIEVVPPALRLYRAMQGCLFGTAVGDAIGLPFEGMSSWRIKKFNPLPLKHRFLFGRGMLSDDTEHSCMVAHALIFSVNDPKLFADNMAWSLRWWLLGLPAGIGMATLKACLKLWILFNPDKSGVFSAGNGPAMRSALLGVYAHDDRELRHSLVEINTRITHTDPKAVKGALIVAELAAHNTRGQPVSSNNCRQTLDPIIEDDDELKAIVDQVINSVEQGQTAIEYCQANGHSKGVSGYIYHTLPVVLHIVLRQNHDFEQAINEAVACGGDTDTVAAITGGIVGANTGINGIPEHWISDLHDWPRDNRYLQQLVDDMVAVKWFKKAGRTQWIDPVRLLIRNSFFMLWVLLHGFRRLLPPY